MHNMNRAGRFCQKSSTFQPKEVPNINIGMSSNEVYVIHSTMHYMNSAGWWRNTANSRPSFNN